jgi:hypothetical protein
MGEDTNVRFLAFITYLPDKIIDWENIRHFVAGGFHHSF